MRVMSIKIASSLSKFRHLQQTKKTFKLSTVYSEILDKIDFYNLLGRTRADTRIKVRSKL